LRTQYIILTIFFKWCFTGAPKKIVIITRPGKQQKASSPPQILVLTLLPANPLPCYHLSKTLKLLKPDTLTFAAGLNDIAPKGVK
jgi:hypothetical protein